MADGSATGWSTSHRGDRPRAAARRAPRPQRQRRAQARSAAAPAPGVGRRRCRRAATSRTGSPSRPAATRPAFWELCLYDVQPAALLGGDAIAARQRAARQSGVVLGGGVGVDRRPSRSDSIATIVLNDHEEVGSASTTGAAGPLLERVHRASCDGARWSARRLPAGARRVVLRLRRQRPRRPSQLRRAPRSRSPPDGQRRAGDQDQQQPALRHVARQTAAVFRRRLRRGRCAVPGVRVAQQHAVRLARSGRSRRRGSASPPSTSAFRSCRCTRRASCAASTIHRR